jgi:hypothetical protein
MRSSSDGAPGDAHGRRRALLVATEDGALERFVLNRATARFTAEGALTGARLRFPDPE